VADARWKKQERQVAAMLGVTRNPNNGRRQSDIDVGAFAVEHKARKTLPSWFTDAVAQASASANGRTPVVVLTEVRQGMKARRYVVLRFADWVDLYGDPQERTFG